MEAQIEPAEGVQRLDPERLRYLTENFAKLQGLNLVLMGSFFFLTEIESQVPPIPLSVFLLALALFIVAFRYLRKYYERRFGWIEPPSPSNTSAIIFFVVFLVLLLFGRFFERAAGVFFGGASDGIHALISDPGHRVDLFHPLCFVLVAFGSLPGRLLDRSKAMFICSGLLVWYVAFVFLPLRDPNLTQFVAWKILRVGCFGLSCIALGLYNHMTLLRLIPHRVMEEEKNEE